MEPLSPSPPLLFLLLILGQTTLSLVTSQTYRNITIGSTLSPFGSNNSIASSSGDFAFGFYPLDSNNSLFLLAVWFNATAPQTVVWFATNGTDTVQVPARSVLQLTQTGLLSLFDPSGQEVWNAGPTNATHAILDNSGNLILYDDDEKGPLWQSFDAPTDTLLPGQALAQGHDLQSKLTDSNFSMGRFVLAAQGDGNLVLYPVVVPTNNFYHAYWASSTQNGIQLVFNSTGSLYYLLSNNSLLSIPITTDNSSEQYYYRRATLDPDGVLRVYTYKKSSATWTVVGQLPADGCNVQSYVCGSNAYCKSDNIQMQVDCECPPHYSLIDPQHKYKGCEPDFALQRCDIDQSAEYFFTELPNSDWSASDYEQYSTPTDEATCKEDCLSDCFCAGVVVQGANCLKLRLPLMNGRQKSSIVGKSLLKVAANNASLPPELPKLVPPEIVKKANRSMLMLVISVMIDSLVFIVAFVVIAFCINRKKKVETIKSNSSMLGLNLRVFTHKELEDATGGFSQELGSGAFGTVYKGSIELEFQSSIAVKKLERSVKETEMEFTNELRSIGQTHHKNLVRLIGFCNEGQHRMLVYEYMSNGSLTSFLFGSAKPSWNQRAQMALGIARGLVYLHEECRTQIIHCDIKSQNILLDDDFTPKISDFGLAKLLRADQTRTNTGIRGTRGYVAPEWFKNLAITTKVDVYSFGVLLLEIVCCRKNLEIEVADEATAVLTYWAYDCFRAGRLDLLLIEGDEEAKADMRRVERFVMAAIWCVQEEPSLRPSMQKISQMLEGAITVSIPPDPSPYAIANL